MDGIEIKEPFMPQIGDEVVRVAAWLTGSDNEFSGRESVITKVLHKMRTGNWFVEIENSECHYVRFDKDIVAWVTTISG